MSRMGKVIWFWFYYPFIPVLAVHYSAVLVMAILEKIFRRYVRPVFDRDDHTELIFMSMFGHATVLAIIWPILYGLIVVYAMIY